MKKQFVLFLGAICVYLMTTSVRAEMPNGMFRLHLFSNIIEVGTGEVTPDGGAEDQFGGLEFGAGLSRFGIGFGYTLGKGFVIGGRVALGSESYDWSPGNDGDHFLCSVIPYVEYVFLNTRVRPFVRGMLGFEGAHYDNGGGFWGFVTGGGGGIHVFLRPNVSMDFVLDLAIRGGTGHWDNGNAPDVDYSHWRFSFSTLFGLSAWL